MVIEHMQSENVQQWDRTMATFSHPRYELPDGTVFDGPDEVMQFWLDGRTTVPDQTNELIELTHLDDGDVLIEFWLRGTPVATSESFEVRLWAIFGFDDEDLITGERVYAQPPGGAPHE
ncbi:hypothetical protein A9X01_08470 [Mycobacterium asiaticum]|uniref:SnoaL-like domain-containing protein n=1 Tax=Mycobacterium asiaticum TaxID=1790 RepID=A0A1A3BBG5_MYCAS|nr:hypothetical protein A9X01_08470 [Mycobacterium asiaticum]